MTQHAVGEHGQRIARVERECRAVLGGQGRAAAPAQAAVDDVVVHEERVVQQLDRHGGRQDVRRPAAEGAGSGQAEGRAQGLAGPARVDARDAVEPGVRLPVGDRVEHRPAHGVVHRGQAILDEVRVRPRSWRPKQARRPRSASTRLRAPRPGRCRGRCPAGADGSTTTEMVNPRLERDGRPSILGGSISTSPSSTLPWTSSAGRIAGRARRDRPGCRCAATSRRAHVARRQATIVSGRDGDEAAVDADLHALAGRSDVGAAEPLQGI